MAICVLKQLQVLLNRNINDYKAKNKDLYRLLLNPQFYFLIKERERLISHHFKNQNDFLNFLNPILEDLKKEKYKFQKCESNLIFPSSNFKDFLTEKTILELLEILFNPNFSKFNTNHHGDPRKIVQNFQKKWRNSNWILELELDSFSINFGILLNLLRKKIQDERFINLVWCLVKTKGTKEEVNFQSKILSPSYLIFQTIYFHELESFLKSSFLDPPFLLLRSNQKIIFAIFGSRSLVKEVEDSIENFHKNYFDFSKKRIKVLFFPQNPIFYRGFLLKLKKIGLSSKQVSRVSLEVPLKIFLNYLVQKNFCFSSGVSLKKKGWMHYSDEKIIERYNKILQDFCSFYFFTENFNKSFKRIEYILKYSCAHTLAAKHRSRISVQFTRKDLKSLYNLFFTRKKLRDSYFSLKNKKCLYIEDEITKVSFNSITKNK